MYYLFVRLPADLYKEAELKGFPREVYWDRLLTFTGVKESTMQIILQRRIWSARNGPI